MTDFDIFNGDADGICSLVQLRLAQPRAAELVTGVKRDIALLDRVEAKDGDRLTVLDVSMRTNGDALRRHLAVGAKVFYADHHNAGDIPEHPGLDAHIDTSPSACSAIIVDRYLEGAHSLWAVTAAFGDGLAAVAREMCGPLGLGEHEAARLERLGVLLNYNGYGESEADLHFHPAELFRLAVPYASPFAFMDDASEVFARLDEGYRADMAAADAAEELLAADGVRAVLLPDSAASRRVSGTYGNALAAAHPERAHAILTQASTGGYVVSVRAPKVQPEGADQLCLGFETGGGRAGAAGINHLPHADLDRFLSAFRDAYPSSQGTA